MSTSSMDKTTEQSGNEIRSSTTSSGVPPPTPMASEEEESQEAVNERRKKAFEYTKSVLLGKVIKTTLSDGRTLTGKFICIDRLKNLILTNVTEERYIDPSKYRYRVNDGDDNEAKKSADDSGEVPTERRIRVERHISQAMIPGFRLVKAEISRDLLEEGESSSDVDDGMKLSD